MFKNMIKHLLLWSFFLLLIFFMTEVVTAKEMCLKMQYKYPNKHEKITTFIKTYDIKKDRAYILSDYILYIGERHELDPLLLASILGVESSYRFDAINPMSKDYGAIQLNLRVWKREFKRLNIDFNLDLFNSSKIYQIKVMATILNVLKNRHKEDCFWWARYHSSTPKFKKIYIKKIEKMITKIAN